MLGPKQLRTRLAELEAHVSVVDEHCPRKRIRFARASTGQFLALEEGMWSTSSLLKFAPV